MQVGVAVFTVVAVCGTTGVPFGHKLKSTREILRAIGYPEPPAPGGTYRVQCHVLCMIVEYFNVVWLLLLCRFLPSLMAVALRKVSTLLHQNKRHKP